MHTVIYIYTHINIHTLRRPWYTNGWFAKYHLYAFDIYKSEISLQTGFHLGASKKIQSFRCVMLMPVLMCGITSRVLLWMGVAVLLDDFELAVY